MRWSLPLEMQMYVLLPLFYVIARGRRREMAALVAAMLGLGFAETSSLIDRVPGMWRLGVFTFGPCFVSGVLAYHLLRRRPAPRLPSSSWPLIIGAVAAGFAALKPDVAHPELG